MFPLILFWLTLLGLPSSAVVAWLCGPPDIKPVAVAIGSVFIVSSGLDVIPLIREHMDFHVVDIASTFILAAWLLILALRSTSSLWVGVLLIVQSVELALAATQLGADPIFAPTSIGFSISVNLISIVLIATLLMATFIRPRNQCTSRYLYSE